jgi:hypothetical protein
VTSSNLLLGEATISAHISPRNPIENGRLLRVTLGFRSDPLPVVKRVDVKVRAFDSAGHEFPVAPASLMGDYFVPAIPKVTHCDGYYTVEAGSGEVAKITVAWKGEEMEVSVPYRAPLASFPNIQ